MGELGAIFYQGPSLLTGDPIVGVLTGLQGGSKNAKTGPMAQAWILRADMPPMEAKRRNLDDAICGDCKLRGADGFDAICYVTPWLGPYNVYRHLPQYGVATWSELQALVEGRHVRLGAYGDPAAIPFEVWRTLLVTTAGFVAYTHQWRRCDRRLQTIAMASTDDAAETREAWAAGWRTFRVRAATELLLTRRRVLAGRPVCEPLEIVCPASTEAGHRTTCQRCQLCRGASRPARSIVIVAHGKPGNLTAFYRSHAEATAGTA